LNGFENVARLGDARPVNLLLGLVVRLGGGRAVLSTTAAVKVLADALCLIALERAGVCLFLRHTYGGQGIKNFPALYFELAC
jgi:hypothetical protein